MVEVVQENRDALFEELESDQAFGPIFKAFDGIWPEGEKERKRIKVLKPQLFWSGKKLKYQETFCVPRKSILRLLELANDTRSAGHFAFVKTFHRLQEFLWKHKSQDVGAYCDWCQTCQQQQNSTGQALHDPILVGLSGRRWGLIAMDFIVDLPETANGHNAIITIADRLSWRVHFLLSRTTDSEKETAGLIFRYILSQNGLPDAIISSRDTNFTFKFWRELLEL